MKNNQFELVAIGFWFESDLPKWPDPRLLVNYNWDQKLKSEIVKYLKNGFIVGEFLGYSWCRINGSQYDMDENLGCCEFTDGIFLWPEGLVYYLETFDIELPSFFVETLIKNKFQRNEYNIKILSEEVELSLDTLEQDNEKYKTSYVKWLNWWESYASR